MYVRKSINFNGIEYLTVGEVMGIKRDAGVWCWLVSFGRDNIEFWGYWRVDAAERLW